jgi:hypothetical protein
MKDITLYTSEEQVETLVKNIIKSQIKDKVLLLIDNRVQYTLNTITENFIRKELFDFIHSEEFMKDMNKSFLMWVKIKNSYLEKN